MTNLTPIEGVLSGADIENIAGWLITCRRSDSLEEIFEEHASTIVGWFCLLLDEIERQNNLLEDLNSLAPEQIHVSPAEKDKCEDYSCSYCYPSHTCYTICGETGHEWMQWDDDDSDDPTFCVRCGKRQELDWIEDPDYCWQRYAETEGAHSIHDWVQVGEFRDERGAMISTNKEKRQMCRICLVIEEPDVKHGTYLDEGNGKVAPLDNGPDPILIDPHECGHKYWQRYDDSGWSRCLGCGTWTPPMDQCPAAPEHDVVATGVGGTGIVWCCQHCHQEFDGKLPSNHPIVIDNRTPPVEIGPVLPDPVGYQTPDVQEHLPMEVPQAIPLGPVGGTAPAAADGDECSTDCVDPTCPKFHAPPRQEEWDHPWQPKDDDSPFREEGACGLCGWSDPHTHQPGGAGAASAVPSTDLIFQPGNPLERPPAIPTGAEIKRARKQRRAERVATRNRMEPGPLVAAALERARRFSSTPGTTPPLALTKSNPVMRLESCFCCEQELDFDKRELTVCTSCAEDDMIAAEVLAAEADQADLLNLFVRLRAETVYLGDPNVIDVESTEVEIDHEDSPFTSEAAYAQTQDQPSHSLVPRRTQESGWAA